MLELKIFNIDAYNYYLIDKNNREYNLNIEFYNIENNPGIDDLIYADEKLLGKEGVFSFGSIDKKYGRDMIDLEDEDILVLKINNKLINLKRYYG